MSGFFHLEDRPQVHETRDLKGVALRLHRDDGPGWTEVVRTTRC
jgi:hypothetical protein